MKPLIIIVLFLAIASAVFGQIVWTNPITGSNPGANNPYTTGQTVNGNLTVSGIGRGSGIGKVDAANQYAADGWPESGSLGANDYFLFHPHPELKLLDQFILFCVYLTEQQWSH
jgi:hypothetical protein